MSNLAIGLSLLPRHTRRIPNRSACLDTGLSPCLFPYGLQKQLESFLNLEKFPEILGLLESCVRAVRSRSGLSASLATKAPCHPVVRSRVKSTNVSQWALNVYHGLPIAQCPLWRSQTAKVAIIDLVVRMVRILCRPTELFVHSLPGRLPMRLRTAWLTAVVMIGPLMGSVLAKTIAIGEVVPNLEFKDIRYLRRSLSDLGTHKGFALLFLNTDCPVSKRFLPKLRELNAFYSQKDIQFVGVFCSAQDTVMRIASFALENDLRFPVVKDEENAICTALGIDRVPQVAVLDSGNRLAYRGRINDQYRVSGTQPGAQPRRPRNGARRAVGR